MYRFETFDELWATFKREHLDLWTLYKNEKRPYLTPHTFRENAPFQMKKAHDIGCCCIFCEGFNELRRGANGVIAKIDAILDKMKAARMSDANAALVSLLDKVKHIIALPSKYDTIVACLHPCLASDAKLESAQFSCINGSECHACGFRQLWSSQIRKKLLTDDDEMRNNFILAGTE